jgi:hypothetical protein
VFADQTIIGFRVVIEEYFFPALFVMACTAHWPELALVFGVLLMAFEAKSRHLVDEPITFVATRAFRLFVLAP